MLLPKAGNLTTDLSNWSDLSGSYTSTNTTRFVWDGWNLFAEIIQNQQSTITNDYTWDFDLSQSLQGAGGIGGLLAVSKGGVGLPPATYFPVYDGRNLLLDLNAPGNNQSLDCWVWDGTQILTTLGGRNKFRYQPQVIFDVAGSGQPATKETLWQVAYNAAGQSVYDFTSSKSVFMWDAATINITLQVLTPDGTQTCPIDGSPSPVQFQLTQQP